MYKLQSSGNHLLVCGLNMVGCASSMAWKKSTTPPPEVDVLGAATDVEATGNGGGAVVSLAEMSSVMVCDEGLQFTFHGRLLRSILADTVRGGFVGLIFDAILFEVGIIQVLL